MAFCKRLCLGIVGLALRDSDTPEERRRKTLTVPVSLVCTAVALFTLFTDILQQTFRFRALGALIACASCGFISLWPMLTGSLSLSTFGRAGTGLTVSIIFLDWYVTSAGGQRLWPLVILQMDLYLAVGMPKLYQLLALHTTAVWLIVDQIEFEMRLGVYDVEGTSSRFEEVTCACAAPPCGGKNPIAIMVGLAVVLLMLYADYFATRGFAEGMQSEKARVLTSVQVADLVSDMLVHFDLDGAGSALEEAEDALPAGLLRSFRHLLRNLASYRPYLPQSCFEQGAADEEGGSSEGEGAQSAVGASMNEDIADGAQAPPRPRPSVDSRGRPRFSRHGSTSSLGSRASRLSSSTGSAAPPVVQGRHRPQMRRMTALARNACDFLKFVSQADWPEVTEAVAAAVGGFVQTVGSLGGVCDSLSGDHLSATFGAVKVQGSHRVSATHAAGQLTAQSPVPITIGVCTGRALCGDFGSAAAQRFMVLGGVGSFLPVVERVAAAWGLGTLIDSGVEADAQQSWNCRLRKMVMFPKLASSPIGLWEVMSAKAAAGEPEEWMYELENAGPNPWGPYNEAVAQWCRGAEATAVLALVAAALDKCPETEVREALRAFRASFQHWGPPVGEVGIAASAGAPAAVGAQLGAADKPPFERADHS